MVEHRLSLTSSEVACRAVSAASRPCREAGVLEPATHPASPKNPLEAVVGDIRRATRRVYSAENKAGSCLRGCFASSASPILCRLEGIVDNMFYSRFPRMD